MFSLNTNKISALDDNYKKLTRIDCYNYNSVTFDGCYYYFTMLCKMLIVQMDTSFNIIKVFDTYKRYDKILYDPVLECFWATREKGCRFIYKLDKNFIELDYICVRNYKGSGRITGLSYDCLNDKLIVTFPQAIVSVSKSNGESTLLQTSFEEWYTDIICINPYLLAFTVSSTETKLIRYKLEDDVLSVVSSNTIPNNLNIKSLTFTNITNLCDDIDEDEDVEVTIDYLAIYDCESYLSSTTTTFDELCSCNCWVNDSTCLDCDCCDEICKVIDAIAKIEIELANLLNAESEKINYATKNSATIDELVAINNSVSKTVKKITELELTIIELLDVL